MSTEKYDFVYHHIYEAILEQKLAPGTRLSEESLSEIFKVSRTIVRKSLQKLAHEQVVQLRPNKGAIVASVSIDETKQIFYARRVVEKAIIELVVTNHSKDDLQELLDFVDREKKCFLSGERSEGIRLSGEFHLKLADIAGNPQLKNFHRSLVPQTSLIIAQYEKRGLNHCSYDEHYELVMSIKSGKVEETVMLMMDHLDHIEAKLQLDSVPISQNISDIFSNL